MMLSMGAILILFLSTLSLRRATCDFSQKRHPPHNFYPRSPCGERQHRVGEFQGVHYISIHALLAESDNSPAHAN